MPGNSHSGLVTGRLDAILSVDNIHTIHWIISFVLTNRSSNIERQLRNASYQLIIFQMGPGLLFLTLLVINYSFVHLYESPADRHRMNEDRRITRRGSLIDPITKQLHYPSTSVELSLSSELTRCSSFNLSNSRINAIKVAAQCTVQIY